MIPKHIPPLIFYRILNVAKRNTLKLNITTWLYLKEYLPRKTTIYLTFCRSTLLDLLSLYNCHPAISSPPSSHNNLYVHMHICTHWVLIYQSMLPINAWGYIQFWIHFHMVYKAPYNLTPMSLGIPSCLGFLLPKSENLFDSF